MPIPMLPSPSWRETIPIVQILRPTLRPNLRAFWFCATTGPPYSLTTPVGQPIPAQPTPIILAPSTSLLCPSEAPSVPHPSTLGPPYPSLSPQPIQTTPLPTHDSFNPVTCNWSLHHIPEFLEPGSTLLKRSSTSACSTLKKIQLNDDRLGIGILVTQQLPDHVAGEAGP